MSHQEPISLIRFAAQIGVTERCLRRWCTQGKIIGARKASFDQKMGYLPACQARYWHRQMALSRAQRGCVMTDDQKNEWHRLMVEIDVNLNALFARLETWERVEDYMRGAIEHQRWVQEGCPDFEPEDDEPDDLADVLAAVPGCLLNGGRHD